MTNRKLVVGTGSAIILAALGASPMLFGNTFIETLNMRPFAAMMILGGTLAVVGMFWFMRRI